MNRICVFCGSSTGVRPWYAEMAKQVGKEFLRRKIGLIYGGGNVGLMGVLADEVLMGGGEVVGVIPGFLVEKEFAHVGLSALHVVGSMHERKALMADLSDAFMAIPGGFGTLEEICEIVTWKQLTLHHKPCGLLNVDGFFDHLLAFFDYQVNEGFVTSENRALVCASQDINNLLDLLSSVAM